jgi:hypothetical protein
MPSYQYFDTFYFPPPIPPELPCTHVLEDGTTFTQAAYRTNLGDNILCIYADNGCLITKNNIHAFPIRTDVETQSQWHGVNCFSDNPEECPFTV